MNNETNFDKFIGSPEAAAKMILGRNETVYAQMMHEFFKRNGVVKGSEFEEKFAEFLREPVSDESRDMISGGESMMKAVGDKRTVYEFEPYIKVIERPYENGGRKFDMHWVEQNHGVPGVVIIATDGESTVLERHYRVATGRSHIELPRGGGAALDGFDTMESAIANAVRELHEESGIDVQDCECEYVGRIYSDPGVLSTAVDVVKCHVASGALDSLASLDDDEDIDTVMSVDNDVVFELIRSNAIDDALTLSALMISFR